MRVGVNTGEVIVANVGDANYNEDTAMGEALTVGFAHGDFGRARHHPGE